MDNGKKLFLISLTYLITYYIYISLVTPWSGDFQSGLRYLLPVGFFIIFIIASFDIRFTRVFYFIGAVSLLYFIFTLYSLSAPTTYNRAHRWLASNFNQADVTIVNRVDQLLLPKNKVSYLLEREESCYTRCDFVKKYNLNEDIKPLVVDQFSRDGVLQGAKVYHIEETMPDDGSRELVKFIGNNVNDKSYFSVDYHTGNYFSWDFFKIKNFGKNLYIYAE